MTRHAGMRYRRLLRRAEHPVQKLEAEVEHLHEVEERGEAGSTPFILYGGLVLFLLPLVLLLTALTFAVYYLAA
jgi:hypothetical protein